MIRSEVVYSTFVYLLRAHIRNINTCRYTTSAHELSGCVGAAAYNFLYLFCIILFNNNNIMLPGPGPVYTAYDS